MQNTIFRINLFQIQCFESLTCSLGEPEKKICWNSTQETEQSIFRINFWIRFGIMTPMILQNIIFAACLFRLESFDWWTYPFGEPKKKSVEPRSRKHFGAYSELSFELGSTLSLQWFCKIAFSELAYFELKVLFAERVPLESQEKKICWTSQQGTEQSIFRVIFWIRFDIIATMILINNLFTTNLFRIESFWSWPCPLGCQTKKKKSVVRT